MFSKIRDTTLKVCTNECVIQYVRVHSHSHICQKEKIWKSQ